MNINFNNITDAYYSNQIALNKIYGQNGLLLWERKEPFVYTDCITFKSTNPFTLSYNGKTWTGTLEYSTDYINWTTWDGTTTLSSGLYDEINKLHVRGYNNTRVTALGNRWILTGNNIECEGDIRTLLNYNDVNNITRIADGAFYNMFKGNESLISAPELLITKLSNSCYMSMFEDCINLSKAPSILPATGVMSSCYEAMFKNCTSLIEAPEILATGLGKDITGNIKGGQACCEMFYGCINLTKVQEKFYQDTLANACYARMFMNCSSLTTAPELIADELSDLCYGAMFDGCSKLNYIKMLATKKPSDVSWDRCLNGWTNGVAVIGTFIKSSSNTSLSSGVNGIPSGWTVQNA